MSVTLEELGFSDKKKTEQKEVSKHKKSEKVKKQKTKKIEEDKFMKTFKRISIVFVSSLGAVLAVALVLKLILILF